MSCIQFNLKFKKYKLSLENLHSPQYRMNSQIFYMKSQPFHLNKKTFPISIILILIMFGFVHSTSHVPVLSENIMKNIFNNHQQMIIYVCQTPNQNHFQHFSDYCLDHPCAFLEKNNELYQNIRNFVGHPDKQYFLILDAPRQLKYVLQVEDKTIQYKNIYNFEADFTSQKLKPYFSSEQQPSEVYEPCRKLVGTNFNQFLALKAPIKVVYLYTEQQTCNICGQMLRGFADVAQKIYRDDVITFGYFDIFKNDHQKIPSQIAPFFLVFKQGESQPFGIEGQKFPQLETALVNIIAQHIYPEYRNTRQNQQQVKPKDLEEQTIEQIGQLNVLEREQIVGNNYEL